MALPWRSWGRGRESTKGASGGRRSFEGLTILELVAVMVVLAVLGAIAVPTVTSILHRSETAVTEQSLVDLADAVQSIAQLRTGTPDSVPDATDWQQGLAECPNCAAAAGSGVLAAAGASWTLHFTTQEPPLSSSPTDLEAYRDGVRWGAQILSPSGTQVDVVASGGASPSILSTLGCISLAAAVAGEHTCTQARSATPATPVRLEAVAKPGSFTLSWSPPASGPAPTGYQVSCTDATGQVVRGATTGTTYADSSADNGVTYTCTVTAESPLYDSPPSTSVPVTPYGTPAPPSDLVATAGERQVALTWDAAPSSSAAPVTGYHLWRAAASAGPYTEIATIAEPGYTDTTLVAGVTYFYEVAAYNADATSARVGPVTATPTGPPTFDLAAAGTGALDGLARSGTGVTVAGGARVTVDGTVAVASTSATGLSVVDGARLDTNGIDTVDTSPSTFCRTCHLHTRANATPWPPTHVASVADPLADLPAPSTAGLRTYDTSSLEGPGIYTAAVTVGGGTTLTLTSGAYVFEDGLTIANGATVTSGPGGVLFYVAGGAVNFSGGATLDLTAPTSGPWAGIVVDQARADAATMTIDGGTTTTSYDGVVYAPRAEVRFAGGSSVAIGGVVAKAVVADNGSRVVVGPAFTFTHGRQTSYTIGTSSSGSTTLTATGLPAGTAFHTLGNDTATLSGDPTVPAGTYSIEVTATDATGSTSQAYVISVLA